MLKNDFCCKARECYLSFLKALILLSAVMLLPAFASAQTEDEMKMLSMYFKEDQLVYAPTRSLKPLSQVAENISIVTAQDIEAMNAHMLSKVLEIVTGLFFYNTMNDFGTSGFAFIQGSDFYNDDRRTLILLDGMPWNFMAGGTHTINTIPVKIVKRIEIIKGPASSAWGSSLGGVINIVTKNTGDKAVPSGSVSASYGERNSQDYNAEIMGKAGTVGYYLHVDRMDSDGLRKNRYFERDSLYSKFDVPLFPDINLTLTAGYSDPHFKYNDYIEWDYSNVANFRAFFITAVLTAKVTDELGVEASFYRYKQKFVSRNDVLSDTGFWDAVYGIDLNAGDTFNQWIYDETTKGGTAKVLWNNSVHNAVAGLDISHGSLDQISMSTGADDDINHPGISKWAVFVNDTISFGDLSITPGLRHDKNNVSGDFTSPSLGATYRIGRKTVLRASVARGFAYPPITYTSSEELYLKPNPDLKPEKVWSYQAGAEAFIFDFLNAKAVLFYHELKNEIQFQYDGAVGKYQYINGGGEAKRTGAEFDLETIPFYNVSMKTGLSYVRKELVPEENFPDAVNVTNIYDCNVIVKYDDVKSLSAQLSGNYTWWDFPWEGKYNTFIWDLSLGKKIYSVDKISTDVFLVVHNIFNSSSIIDKPSDTDNPRRWLEAGISLKF